MTGQGDTPAERRPIASRDRKVFQRLAGWLARHRVSPNAISMASVVFAVGAGAALVATGGADEPMTRLYWLGAAACIQLRLLANMFDGMVAFETDQASPVGELFNEVPDRVSDTAILVGAGLSVGGSPTMGAAAALVAMFVAYVRAVGGSVGAGQVFCGPMAKPHRMFLLTITCVYGASAPIAWRPVSADWGWGVMAWSLGIIIVGGLFTSIRRLVRIARVIRERST